MQIINKLSKLEINFDLPKLEVELKKKPYEITLENVKLVSSGIKGETYTGEYDITPNFDTQTLETENKILKENITVEPIFISRTTNSSGGNTVYIGGIING